MSTNHLYLLALPAILACASASATSGASGAPPAPRRSTLLVADEISTANLDRGTAYDAIARLRPNWLARTTRSFDPPSNEGPAVFIDGQRFGDLASLRNVDADRIDEVRFYSAAEAGGLFGLQAGMSGVVAVTTKKR
jgi:hypothetical protein